jgi:hypothetical protein
VLLLLQLLPLFCACLDLVVTVQHCGYATLCVKLMLLSCVCLQIVAAVREGRRVWDNLRKILLFNLPVNFAQGGSICECVVCWSGCCLALGGGGAIRRSACKRWCAGLC